MLDACEWSAFLPVGYKDADSAFLDGLDELECSADFSEATATNAAHGLLSSSSPTSNSPAPGARLVAPKPQLPQVQVPPPSVWFPTWPDCDATTGCGTCTLHHLCQHSPWPGATKPVVNSQTIFTSGGNALPWQTSTPSSGESYSTLSACAACLTPEVLAPVTTGFDRIGSVTGRMDALKALDQHIVAVVPQGTQRSPSPSPASNAASAMAARPAINPAEAPPPAPPVSAAAAKPAAVKGGNKKRSRQEVAAEATTTGVVKRSSKRMRCWNCGAHSTPQWRCGPDGPRTLCNACGVRYKKGLPLAYKEAEVKLQGAAAHAAAPAGEQAKCAQPQ